MAHSEVGLDTLAKLVRHNSSQRAAQPALREKTRGIWRTMTWRDLADESAALAAGLQARGLKRGAHVALIGDNRPRLYAAMCAVQCLGAVPVPLYQDAVAEEMVFPIQNAEIAMAFAALEGAGVAERALSEDRFSEHHLLRSAEEECGCAEEFG